MSKSKIISNDAAEKCQSWIAPSVGDNTNDSNRSLLTASQLEAVQKQAHDEAYAVGLAEGIAAGQQQIQQEVNNLKGVMASLSVPFNDLDKQVDKEIVILVQSLVRQMLRREAKQDPGQIMAVVRDAIKSLPVASRSLQLRLHPDDASLVREVYKTNDQDTAWDVVEDPLISRGGCKIITPVTEVDATLETRLSQLFAQVFGERQQDVDS
ncbi:MAG: flagellar assembly protein FliH [Gammaproteobacteria bacterium]|nr:flagellar assembly protein FliH [Gammaproteobacteria bacterium]